MTPKTRARYTQLSELTRLILDAELSVSRNLKAQVDELRLQFDRMEGPWDRSQQGDFQLQAKLAEKHALWREERRRQINHELAQLLAELATQQTVLRRAFGRHVVAEKLSGKR